MTREPTIICGVGINDADYKVKTTFGGVQKVCPYYNCWRNMVTRCYDKNEHKRSPRYKDCAVCDEWLSFITFKSWMVTQDWQDKQLDKDLILPGNKIYAPEFCCFVSPYVNSLLTNTGKTTKGQLRGVALLKSGRYSATCNTKPKKRVHIGVFNTAEEAHSAWVKAKGGLLRNVAASESNMAVANALMRHARLLEERKDGGR